eukprot:scaffold333986_cov16-Prasinocladus_malaysianus.AAC.1
MKSIVKPIKLLVWSVLSPGHMLMQLDECPRDQSELQAILKEVRAAGPSQPESSWLSQQTDDTSPLNLRTYSTLSMQKRRLCFEALSGL